MNAVTLRQFIGRNPKLGTAAAEIVLSGSVRPVESRAGQMPMFDEDMLIVASRVRMMEAHIGCVRSSVEERSMQYTVAARELGI